LRVYTQNGASVECKIMHMEPEWKECGDWAGEEQAAK
jgi:hypothetical protein